MSSFEQFKIAEKIASSRLIPLQYQGKAADVFVGLQMAENLNVNIVELLNNIYVVGGKATLNASLMISLCNRSGKFKSPIQYEVKGTGDSLSVTAFAYLLAGNRVSATTTFRMAQQEGWTRNPMYNSMPEHLLKLKSACFLIRTYCPEVSLSGIHSVEEMKDVEAKNQSSVNTINKLNQQIKKEGIIT